MADSCILTAYARFDDPSAVNKLLEPIRNADDLRETLKSGQPLRARIWDRETRTARFIVSDGLTVGCYTVTEVTAKEAARIGSECESVATLGSNEFCSIVQRALGISTFTVQ
jgi:hypothetical protein